MAAEFFGITESDWYCWEDEDHQRSIDRNRGFLSDEERHRDRKMNNFFAFINMVEPSLLSSNPFPTPLDYRAPTHSEILELDGSHAPSSSYITGVSSSNDCSSRLSGTNSYNFQLAQEKIHNPYKFHYENFWSLTQNQQHYIMGMIDGMKLKDLNFSPPISSFTQTSHGRIHTIDTMSEREREEHEIRKAQLKFYKSKNRKNM